MAELSRTAAPARIGEGGGERGNADIGLPEALARAIARAVRGLRYGSVEITVHDGSVVPIERKEKIRLGRDETRPAR